MHKVFFSQENATGKFSGEQGCSGPQSRYSTKDGGSFESPVRSRFLNRLVSCLGVFSPPDFMMGFVNKFPLGGGKVPARYGLTF